MATIRRERDYWEGVVYGLCVCVCVCVCVWVREREREWEREWKRESVCLFGISEGSALILHLKAHCRTSSWEPQRDGPCLEVILINLHTHTHTGTHRVIAGATFKRTCVYVSLCIWHQPKLNTKHKYPWQVATCPSLWAYECNCHAVCVCVCVCVCVSTYSCACVLMTSMC